MVTFALSPYLADKKKAVLDRLSRPAKEDAPPIVLVMGNEAGDTDSLASAMLLCHLLSTSTESKYAKAFDSKTAFVPLVQQHRSDLPLRAENEFLFSLMQLSPDDVLFLDDLPSPHELEQRKDILYGLTDHPRLSSYWQPYEHFEKQVVVLVDHHADDGSHKDAKVRVLKGPENGAVASDVSVVVDMFKDDPALKGLPAPLANLALAAVLIDTDDLRPLPGGKATPIDLQAADLLVRQSSFDATTNNADFLQSAIAIGDVKGEELSAAVGVKGNAAQDVSAIAQDARKAQSLYFQILSSKKLDVSRLDTRDLLRRDYKENVAELENNHTFRAGFSSVPVGLSDWVHERHGDGEDRWPKYWQALREWMGERKLDVAVVGTSFRELAEGSGTMEERAKNGKHRRELILAYIEQAQLSSTGKAPSLFPVIKHSLQMDDYAAALGHDSTQRLLLDSPWKGSRRVASTGKRERVEGLRNDEVYGQDDASSSSSSSGGGGEMHIAVWRQLNARASRKVYLPAVLHALKVASRSKGGV